MDAASKIALVKATCLSDEAFNNTVGERISEYRETVLVPILGNDTARIDKLLSELERNLREDHEGLLANLVDIYDAEFTPEEQIAIRQLYESPLWKRFSSAAASMQEKIVEAGSAWLVRAQKTIQTEIAEILDTEVKGKKTAEVAEDPTKKAEHDIWDESLTPT